jgi:hypothetical protein
VHASRRASVDLPDPELPKITRRAIQGSLRSVFELVERGRVRRNLAFGRALSLGFADCGLGEHVQ